MKNLIAISAIVFCLLAAKNSSAQTNNNAAVKADNKTEVAPAPVKQETKQDASIIKAGNGERKIIINEDGRKVLEDDNGIQSFEAPGIVTPQNNNKENSIDKNKPK